MSKTTFLLTLGILCMFGFNTPAAVTWSGQVVDLRSGQPIANVEVYGGAQGRVDLTAAALTGPDGLFSVTYDAGLDLSYWGYYLLTATYRTTPGAYFWYMSQSTSPSHTVIHMVPRNAYIRGVVRDKVTAQSVSGAKVSLGIPGAYVNTVFTDAQGEFQFNPAAYGANNNYEEGIPPAEQVPHESYPTAQPATNYWLEVIASGYRTLHTSDQGLNINLVSSLTPDIHTWVAFDIVPASTNLPPGASARIVNPYGLQLWLAQFFTAEQMTNAVITGATADPDADGLTHQQEYEINTNPNNHDTDHDTLPDGWEHANHLDPLASDAHQDPDHDSFSNRLEYLFGTDPNQPASKPDVALGIRRAVRVDFPTLHGARYQLMTSDSLSGPWTNSGAAFSGNGATVSQYLDAEPAGRQFYRLNLTAE